MFLVSIYRQFKFAIQNFFRNFWLSVVTVTIIILSLFSINTLLALEGISQAVLASVAEKVDISIYFKTDAPQEVVLLTQSKVEGFTEVKATRLVSAEEALEQFKAKHANDPLVKEALIELDTNPLGSSLLVEANAIDDYNSLLDKINSLDLNDVAEDIEFEDRRLIINKLNSLTQRTSLALTIISLVFIAISVLVVFNTIRLGIYAHREEVAIMKLVGASNAFTRMPFIIEGILYAVLSLVIFWVLFFLLLAWVDPVFAGFFSEINFSAKGYFLSNLPTFLWQQLAALAVINTISSYIAISRYLRV